MAQDYVEKDSSDIKIVLKVKDHPFYELRGDDLLINLEISLKEALLGFVKYVK